MTNVASIQAQLDLDTGQFTGAIQTAAGSLRSFNRNINSTNNEINKAARSITGFGARVRDVMVTLGQFRASMLTLWSGTGQWVSAIVAANAELERMQALMRGVAKGDEMTRNAQAAKDLADAINMAQTSPFSLSALGDSMVKLRSAGLEAKEIMEPLTDAVAAFGGNDELLKRSTIAIQQMAGKGVVSMEELRQQLGEAVPTAMSLMARGVGVSMGELTKKVSLGTVEARSAIQAMTLEMAREYSGAGEEMMNTWVGMIAKLKTEWLLFAKEIGDAGLFDAAKDAVAGLSKIMKDPNTINAARTLGESLGSLISTLVSTVNWLTANQSAIITWGEAIAAVVGAGYILSMVRGLGLWGTALTGLQRQITATTGATTGFWAAFAGMNRMQQATTLANGLKAGINGLLASITGFSGPVGVAIIAIGALIGWLVKLRAEAEESTKAMRRALRMKATDILSAEDIKANEERIKDYESIAKRMDDLRGRYSGTPEQMRQEAMRAAYQAGDQDMARRLREAQGPAEIVRLYDLMRRTLARESNALRQSIATSNSNLAILNENEFVSSNAEIIERAINDVTGKFQTEQAELENKIAEGTMSDAAMRAARDDLLRRENAAVVKELDFQIAQREAIANAQVGVERKHTDSLIAELRRRRTEVVQRNNDILAARAAGLQFINKPGGGEDAKKAKQEADALTTYYENLRGKVAGLKAEIEDGNAKLATFDELLAAGKWGKNPNQGMVANVRALHEEMKALQEESKRLKETEKTLNELTTLSSRLDADLLTTENRLSGEMYGQVASGMVSFNRQIMILRNNLPNTNMSLEEFDKKIGEIRSKVQEIDMVRFRDFVEETNMENNNATLTARARRIAEYNNKLREYEILRSRMLSSANNQQQADEINKSVDDMIASEDARFKYESANAWGRWLQDYSDMATKMDDIWGNAIDGMHDGLTEFFTTGKFGWKDFLKTILAEITKLMVAKAVVSFVNMIGSMWGGGSVDTSANLGGANLGYTASANGNIMTDEGPLPLKKYAKGGIAKSPQLSLFGEGRTPEAYVPLPDGRTIPVTMKGDFGGGGGGGVMVNITVNSDGSSTEETSTGESREMGQALGVLVKQTIIKEMRPGGILWKNK